MLSFTIKSQTFKNPITSFPYFEGFESGSHGWKANGDWVLGKPNKTFLNAAANGDYCWVTKITGPYTKNQTSELITPFFDIRNMSTPFMGFTMKYSTNYNDRLYVFYSVDGINWNYLDNYANFQNWSGNIYGSNSSYTNFFKSLEDYDYTTITQVQFKFVFTSSSGNNYNYEGIALDNFFISDYGTSPYNISYDLSLSYIGKEKNINCTNSGLIAIIQNNGYYNNNYNYNSRIYWKVNNYIYSDNFNIATLYDKDYYIHEFSTNSTANQATEFWIDPYNSDYVPSNDSLQYIQPKKIESDLAISIPYSGMLNYECATPALALDLPVTITNLGYANTLIQTINYSINNAPPVTATLNMGSGTICNSNHKTFRFQDSLRINQNGIYNIRVWVSSAVDTFNLNDTVDFSIYYDKMATLPYRESFDGSPQLAAFEYKLPVHWEHVDTNLKTFRVLSQYDSLDLGRGRNHSYDKKGNFLVHSSSNFYYNQGIVSKCIYIPNTSNRIVFEYMAKNIYPNANSMYRFQIYTYNSSYGNSWTMGIYSDEYQRYSIDMEAYKGDSIYIVLSPFYNYPFTSRHVAFDNFRIYESNPMDIALDRIISNTIYGCAEDDFENLSIQLTNLGERSVDSVGICYQIDNDSPHCETLTGGSLQPNQQISYTFKENFRQLTSGSYDLKLYLDNKYDLTKINDTIYNEIVLSNLLNPFRDNFDSAHPYSNWKPIYNLIYSWKKQQGNTPSFNTGPEADASGTGFYYYTETNYSNQAAQTTLRLENCIASEQLDHIVLEYDYHMYGNSIKRLLLNVVSSDSNNRILMSDTIEGEQHTSSSDAWRNRKVFINLPDSIAEFVNLEFVAYKNLGEQADIAIDNIMIRDTITSLKETKLKSENVVWYPNPTNGRIYISSTKQVFYSPDFIVYNSIGEAILRGTYQSEGIDLSQFNHGFYFISLFENDHMISREKVLLLR